MIKVIYCVNGEYGVSSKTPPVIGVIPAETHEEAELISKHLRSSVHNVKVEIVGEELRSRTPTVRTRVPSSIALFTEAKDSWFEALQYLANEEKDFTLRAKWAYALSDMYGAFRDLENELKEI